MVLALKVFGFGLNTDEMLYLFLYYYVSITCNQYLVGIFVWFVHSEYVHAIPNHANVVFYVHAFAIHALELGLALA